MTVSKIKLPRIQDILIYEDENMLAFNKPANMTSEKDNAADGVSLTDLAKRHFERVMLPHRLDRETTGIILAARNEETYRYLSILFERRRIKKTYHAIAEGMSNFDRREIDLPLEKKGSLKAVVDRNHGKPATTIVDTLELFRHYTLVQAEPLTGRFHQIRAHMAAIKSPLMGDALYGGSPFRLSQVKRKYRMSKYQEEEQPVMDRAALHAFSLEFEFPEGQPIKLEAPYPKDFDISLKLLRKNDAV